MAAFALVKYTGIGKFIAGEVSKKMAAFLAEKMGFEIAKDAGISTAIKTGLKGLIAKAGLTSLSVSVGVVGIAAATAALVAFYNYAESKADEKIKLDMSEANKALGDLNSSAKECEKAVNKTKDALKKVEERDENAEAKGKEVENLASAYYKLSKKVNKTKAEKATLKKMSKELSKEIPGLKKNVDKETGAYKGSWKQLKKLVEKTKEYYKAKAAQKDLADIGNKLYENEKDLAKAFKTNALGARNLSIVARKVEAKLVHISTDDVFDGKSQKPYTEFDETHPKTAYGKSKLAGERYVKEFTYKHFIIRSTWVYGLGNNFINQLLEKVDQGENLSIAGDQFGSPTSAKELARFILHLIQTNEYGTYHATNKGVCSRFEFASEILRLTGKQVEMKPVVTHMSDFSRERPAFSVLDNFIMTMTPVYDFPDWKESLKEYMEERGLLNEK